MESNLSTKGFSLVELMVASALFMTVVAVAASAFISVLDASAQSREMNVLMSNLDFALEDMSRNIRVGEGFSVSAEGANNISFQVYASGGLSNKCTVSYGLSNGAILKSKVGHPDCRGYSSVPITSGEIEIERLMFYGDQASVANRQPRIIINLKGTIKGDVEQEFNLQTSVTQRALNLIN